MTRRYALIRCEVVHRQEQKFLTVDKRYCCRDIDVTRGIRMCFGGSVKVVVYYRTETNVEVLHLSHEEFFSKNKR